MSDRDELKKLRMSLVRIAQAAGMDTGQFPPVLELNDYAFDNLVKATERDRGWNALAAAIVGHLEERDNALRALRQELIEMIRGLEP